MIPMFGAVAQVVDIYKRCVAATGHDAAAAITTHDLAPGGRRNILRHPSCRACAVAVQLEKLRITLGLFDNLRTYG